MEKIFLPKMLFIIIVFVHDSFEKLWKGGVYYILKDISRMVAYFLLEVQLYTLT